MPRQPQGFDPRQEMLRADFELQYKRDINLQDVELHHHDFFELYFLMTGDVTYLIEGKIVHVMPGDLLLISPRELHQVCIRPEMSAYERYVLWVDPQLIRKLSTPHSDLFSGLDPDRPGRGNQLRLKHEDRTRIQSLLEQLNQELHADHYGSDLLRESLLVQILVAVNRLVNKQGSQLYEDNQPNRVITQVMNYINLHYNEPLSLDMLAEQFYVSKYHLSHEFNRIVGTSVYRYIQKKRLLIARQLLAQGQKASSVYNLCGFSDYAGFYRAFKGEYGITPSEYVSTAKSWNQERQETE